MRGEEDASTVWPVDTGRQWQVNWLRAMVVSGESGGESEEDSVARDFVPSSFECQVCRETKEPVEDCKLLLRVL